MALRCKQTFATVVAAYLRQSRLAFLPQNQGSRLDPTGGFAAASFSMPPSLLARADEITKSPTCSLWCISPEVALKRTLARSALAPLLGGKRAARAAIAAFVDAGGR